MICSDIAVIQFDFQNKLMYFLLIQILLKAFVFYLNFKVFATKSIHSKMIIFYVKIDFV